MSAVLKTPIPRLREMTSFDLDSVMTIEPTIYSHPWTRGNFKDSLKSGYLCHVYETSGEVIGYSVMMMVMDEAHLLNISIAGGYQRKGLGRMLLNELIAIAKNHQAHTMFLEVRTSNQAAIRLYESIGFNEFSVRKGYYPATDGREDAVLMGLSL